MNDEWKDQSHTSNDFWRYVESFVTSERKNAIEWRLFDLWRLFLYLILRLVGLIDEIPQNDAGTRTLPPISLPIPKVAPPAATRQASPPDDPPGVRSLQKGFFVIPQIGLPHPKLNVFVEMLIRELQHWKHLIRHVTHLSIDWGIFVLQNGTAPRLLSAETMAASSCFGLKRLRVSPAVLS